MNKEIVIEDSLYSEENEADKLIVCSEKMDAKVNDEFVDKVIRFTIRGQIE